ncbi:response regulator transcription factor [Sphingomonas sp. CGMCC 1.13654]|uniref:Response regulator transcription factor n=2 Tax=Sphingomonas chungangi TaxID=2683589 RepID=A0A838LAS3_9SPHN|nr:response regulator transcription factor [Sphingomonas chungangi]MVW57624.1 response regulator [Sphingomonas chungangi]
MAFSLIFRGDPWLAPAAEPDLAIVHVIDDDASLRFALDSLFRSVGLAVRTYGTPREFLDADRGSQPGCLVLDVRLPGVNGLDFQDQINRLGIHLPVVFMTGHGDIPMSVRGMKAGAVDFLAKPFRDQDMLDAVTTAIERDRERQGAAAAADALRSRYETLSPREQQVMALVTAGRLNKQAAGDLELSEITVKIHRGAAMRKMGARTLPDLVRMAEALQVKPDQSR